MNLVYRLTFDFNCIISIENEDEISHFLKQLLILHDQNQITICIPAISGNEKLKSGDYANNFSGFKDRIGKLTNRPLETLASMFELGLSFLDYSILSDQEMKNLEKDIHKVLFPRLPNSWQEYAEMYGYDNSQMNSKWINPRCDVISMWCHIYYRNDIFVTNDNNFFTFDKHRKLLDLGAQKILKPSDVLKSLIRFSA